MKFIQMHDKEETIINLKNVCYIKKNPNKDNDRPYLKISVENLDYYFCYYDSIKERDKAYEKVTQQLGVSFISKVKSKIDELEVKSSNLTPMGKAGYSVFVKKDSVYKNKILKSGKAYDVYRVTNNPSVKYPLMIDIDGQLTCFISEYFANNDCFKLINT